MRLATRRFTFVGLGAATLAAAGAIALARPFSGDARATGGASTWKEVERLVSEQKLEEASQRAAKIREAARASGDEADEAKALIREVQLRTALHGYETSVRFLRDQPWPKALLPRTAVRLFYAQSLVTYARAYAWEIGQREKVASTGAVDLKAWTRDEIAAEAVRAYVEVFRDRETLGGAKVGALDEYLVPNSYPKGIRDTLRDATAYLFVALLADSTFWRPEQSNGVFALDRESLVAGDPPASRLVALEDPSVHPLLKLGAVLDDLEAWHAGKGEREAALEARLERVRRLHAALTDPSDRSLIRRDLARRLVAVPDVPWWAMGKAELAELVRADDRPGSLVKARALALEGAKAYPRSIGGERCRAIVGEIEQPEYRLASMAADGPGRRSIEVTHRNLGALHFRAYAVDLEERLSRARDYNLLPQGKELDALVARAAPAAAFQVDLPSTPDFRLHRTFVTPPALSRGFYVIVASPRADFSTGQNPLRATGLIVTDLVLHVRQADDGRIEARAVSGTTGQPAGGASVALWRYDWQTGHVRAATARSSAADGLVAFTAVPDEQGRSHFLFARRGDDVALDPSFIGFWNRPTPSETSSALVYTDRSIYRPLQKVLWKAVVFRGRSDLARWHVVPQTPVTLTLFDANGQAVETKTVSSNAYGSAAGEFAIPAGRALGAWSVRCATGGAASIRVEEYKRPTFETTLDVPKDALRLNRPATFRGGSRYYFGLPVTNGSVSWRVTREAEYPWWWWGWWGGARPAGAETVATGKASLAADGTFAVTFTPKADERAGKDVTYRYRLSADVTDEGGETRTAERSFRLGFVSV
ncbi:MAG: MG2 domain-containing protein, partial [Acidobacteriota bacterium]